MTVAKLKKVLNDAEVPKTTYSIGKPKDNAYCIEELNGLWAFYSCKRGQKNDCRVFVNFDLAAECLIHNLVR